MARPKELDERTAIGRAVETFRVRGYEGTSTQALCEATGLGRSSVYNTFASKRELFVRAVDHHSERGFQDRTALLTAEGTAIERFRVLFAHVINEKTVHPGRGCLVVDTTAELGDRDPEISARINADTRRHLGLLTECAADGQRDGTVDTARPASDLAESAHTTVADLQLMSRRGAGRAAMEAVAELALRALGAR